MNAYTNRVTGLDASVPPVAKGKKAKEKKGEQSKGQRVESEDVEHPAALGICRECTVGRSLPIFPTVSPRWLRPVTTT